MPKNYSRQSFTLKAAAAIKSFSPRVIAERIVRSFLLRVTEPRRLEAWLPREPHPCQRVW